MNSIRRTFFISKTDNGAYLLEFGEDDYGKRLARCAAFEDIGRAKQWLHDSVDDAFGRLEPPPPPTAD